jgi:hypothetical protein
MHVYMYGYFGSDQIGVDCFCEDLQASPSSMSYYTPGSLTSSRIHHEISPRKGGPMEIRSESEPAYFDLVQAWPPEQLSTGRSPQIQNTCGIATGISRTSSNLMPGK